MRRLALGFAFAALVVACEDPLTVDNPNDPNTNQVLSSAGDLETAISGTFRSIHATTVGGANDNVDNQMKVLAFESYATVNNFGMNVRAPLPRTPILNEPGNNVQTGNNRDFNQLQVQARTTANYIASFDRLQDASPDPILGKDLGRTNAARAFGFFNLGLAQGYTAMVYDQGAVVTPETPIVPAGDLVPYTDVMANALAMMDEAIAIANASAAVEASFRIPTSWIPAADFPSGMSRTDFIRLVRSYKARLRAGVARTPAERAAVDWAAVIADAENGLPNGLVLTLTASGGWDNAWIANQYRYGGWHNMSNHFIGMADTSGAYETWIATKDGNSQSGGGGPFLIRTPDLRFPAGETRAEQNANSPTALLAPPAGRQYFRNRLPGDDTPTPAHGDSWYDHARFFGIFSTPDRVGSWPTMSITELDMLRAEGKFRTNTDIPGALALINKTRTTSGLPALTATGTVPGGNACVPRVPISATATACGDQFEAMKYEKRLETAITGYGQWYFDSRGWGDLPEFTAVHWPVPWQELDVRQLPVYNMGGTDKVCAAGQTPATDGCQSAARSTYGAW